MRGPHRKFFGHQLSCHWFQNFCSPDLRGWGEDKGLYERGRAALVYEAHFFKSLLVPSWMGPE